MLVYFFMFYVYVLGETTQDGIESCLPRLHELVTPTTPRHRNSDLYSSLNHPANCPPPLRLSPAHNPTHSAPRCSPSKPSSSSSQHQTLSDRKVSRSLSFESNQTISLETIPSNQSNSQNSQKHSTSAERAAEKASDPHLVFDFADSDDGIYI